MAFELLEFLRDGAFVTAGFVTAGFVTAGFVTAVCVTADSRPPRRLRIKTGRRGRRFLA
jgi:hypothetical protein